MAQTIQRSSVDLNGVSLRVLIAGRDAWLFTGNGTFRVPSGLLRLPRALSWLVRDLLQPTPSSTLLATVIPQMGCNAACGYCIQNIRTTPTGVERVKAIWMSDEIMAA